MPSQKSSLSTLVVREVGQRGGVQTGDEEVRGWGLVCASSSGQESGREWRGLDGRTKYESRHTPRGPRDLGATVYCYESNRETRVETPGD